MECDPHGPRNTHGPIGPQGGTGKAAGSSRVNSRGYYSWVGYVNTKCDEIRSEERKETAAKAETFVQVDGIRE